MKDSDVASIVDCLAFIGILYGIGSVLHLIAHTEYLKFFFEDYFWPIVIGIVSAIYYKSRH